MAVRQLLVTLSTANLAIFDTSVYIDNLRFSRFQKELLEAAWTDAVYSPNTSCML